MRNKQFRKISYSNEIWCCLYFVDCLDAVALFQLMMTTKTLQGSAHVIA